MKRTTIYLEPDLEVLLKLEMLRQKRPMADIVREAVRAYITRDPPRTPPGAGAFASGTADTAERADEILRQTGFGRSDGAARGRSSSGGRTAPAKKRR